MLGWCARVIAIAWAIFWLWFGVASALAEHQPPATVMLYALRPGLLFVGVAAVAWFRSRLGGVLLILAGLAAAILYQIGFSSAPLSNKILVHLTMSFPPAICGLILVGPWSQKGAHSM